MFANCQQQSGKISSFLLDKAAHSHIALYKDVDLPKGIDAMGSIDAILSDSKKAVAEHTNQAA